MSTTKFLPPELAVRSAWARTNELSSNPDIQSNALRAKEQIDDIKNKVWDSKNDQEIRYVNEVYAAIESSFRNLATIINGRNKDYSDVQKIRDLQSDNIKHYTTFSHELQSSIPRLLGMTVGGSGGATIGVILISILGEWVPNFKDSYLYILVAIGAALGYIINGRYIIPASIRKKQLEIIKLDHDTNLYYINYLARSKDTLKSLYNRVENIHKKIFNQKYDKDLKDETLINNIMIGLQPRMCTKLVKCLDSGYIDPNNWSMCETSQDIDKCVHWT